MAAGRHQHDHHVRLRGSIDDGPCAHEHDRRALAWTYTYDGAGRLTAAVGSGHNYQYGYGAAATCTANPQAGKSTNRTSLIDNGVTVANYCYDAADRLASTTQPGYTTAITYDGHGNTTVIGGQQYTYDAANRHIGT